ncbi:membrane protein [Bacillus methanolicus PB1]|uniref:Membrane protein n=1 Tax=Bacillus methanolicus PB1 TaxID=997296 RepID=I3DWU0_BACMT|nr:hypothetical protein [Bacillus methanolicus]EIJ78711.1 membrane protein [Bacillus methanolicus PB1]
MLKKLIQLGLGFICGYLFINWMPIQYPFLISDFFSEFVLDPLEFLVAAIAFLIGLIANGYLFREGIEKTFAFIRRKNVSFYEIAVNYSVIFSFLIMTRYGIWQTIVLFCFSLLYGMISIDYKNTILAKNNKL